MPAFTGLPVTWGHQGRLTALAWSPDGETLAAADRERMCLWASDGRSRGEIRQADVRSVAWAPSSEAIALACQESPVLVYTLGDNQTTPLPETQPAHSVAWAPQHGWLAYGGRDSPVHLAGNDGGSLLDIEGSYEAEWVYGLSWSPDGAALAAGTQDESHAVRVWDIKRTQGESRPRATLRWSWGPGEVYYALSTSWSPDCRWLAVGFDNGPVRIFDAADGTMLFELQSHSGEVHSVEFSHDGTYLASKDSDEKILVWRAADWASVQIDGLQAGLRADNLLAFHPARNILAMPDASGTGVRLLDIDAEWAAARPRPASDVRYTTAKLVLLGESGVGKTGLGWRLASGEFREHSSTHGQQFWLLPDLTRSRADGTLCETVLWDLAGQPDYRIVHTLFLDDIDLALLVVDPTRRSDMTASVDYWLGQLRLDGSQTPQALLVGARVDRGSPAITRAGLDRLCESLGIAGYLATSAKDGTGLSGLVDRIRQLVDWDALPVTVSSSAFKQAKDFILEVKAAAGSALVPLDRIPAMLAGAASGDAADGSAVSPDEAVRVVRHLETHGFVKVITDSQARRHVLLAPELLSNLAASFVLEARRDPRGLGLLDEDLLAEQGYAFPELGHCAPDEGALLTDATIATFIRHHVCFRQVINDRRLLVFPSLINQDPPPELEHDRVEDVSYEATGPTENLYAALTVQLCYTDLFQESRHWQAQSAFDFGPGQRCYLQVLSASAGLVQLGISYSAGTTGQQRTLFQALVGSFLARTSGLSVAEFATVVCGSCNEHLPTQMVRNRLQRGDRHSFCGNCGTRLELSAPHPIGESAAPVAPRVASKRRQSDNRTAYESVVAQIKTAARLAAGDEPPASCFISYAWASPEEDQWVVRLARDVHNSGIQVYLDRWHCPPGEDISRFTDLIAEAKFALVIGTPELRRKYEDEEADPVLKSELELIGYRLRKSARYGRSVIPLLRAGSGDEAFPVQIAKLARHDFSDDAAYFPRLIELVWQLHGLSLDHPLLDELRAAVGTAG